MSYSLRTNSALGSGMVIALAMFANGAAAATLADLSAGDLVITEIMANPTKVADYKGEWFEIYNDSGMDVDLAGLVIKDAGTDTFTVTTSYTLVAGDSALLAVSSSSSANGGLPTVDVKYNHPYAKMDDAADELYIGYGSVTFDSVSWTKTSYATVAGYSLSLDPNHLDASLNDRSEFWCYSSSMYNSMDYGTPGSTNDSCGIPSYTVDDLVAGDLVISEIMVNPVAKDDAYAEWIEIYNNTGGDVNLNGLIFSDKYTDTFTVSSDLMMYPDDSLLFAVSSNSSRNGGLPTPDYIYNRATYKLYDTGDSVKISNSAGTIDNVNISKTLVSGGPGMSLTLDPTLLDATSNDTEANWCYGSTMYGSGDYGTPSEENDACP